ncbi:hypothetical protein LZF95_07260 [Algoriphagus sp. AGSA1]|uniref:hypothetical protein n=1 Tax=Algoriphagus sp. AGSA1 TaxID=2907213 RepID=UPI001F47B40C|nr:hypothetical protein [Algoriphagus sp. AGSA1]MCE7054465.1 hypothetical protein [Algoriphagus sp. AGSA1]
MDGYDFFIGLCFILISIIIFIIQFRDNAFSRKGFTGGDVKIFCAGVVALLGGLYLIIAAL